MFSTRGDASRRPIALIGHLDTVFPPGTFEGYQRDGELARGPGVLDMKGGLVVVAHALRAIAETVGLDAIAPIRLVIVADEEVGSPEGQGIIREAIADAQGALVFEAGRKGDAIITRRKGTGSMNAVATGRAAHAGNNHKEGKNAIWALARFVDRAQSLTDYARGVTVNVGVISGGTSKNTVPDSAEAQLDLRFETIADGEKLVSDLRAAAEAHGVEGVTIAVTGGVARQPLERTDGERRAHERVRRVRERDRARRERSGAHRRRVRREHVVRDGHRVDRRPRPARHRVSHEGRADRNRDARAQGAGARALLDDVEMKRALLVGIVLACGPHEDYTPLIHVDPNAAKRIGLVHRPDAPPTTTARVHPMRAKSCKDHYFAISAFGLSLQPLLAPLHRLCRRQPAPVRLHQVVLDGRHLE